MFFVDDPVIIPQVVEDLKQQPFADWESFVISENSAAYQQAAAPIQKAETISFFLLLIILVISIGHPCSGTSDVDKRAYDRDWHSNLAWHLSQGDL